MIGVLVINFLVNLIIILSVGLKQVYLISKKMYRRIRHKIFPNEVKMNNLKAKLLREQLELLEER